MDDGFSFTRHLQTKAIEHGREGSTLQDESRGKDGAIDSMQFGTARRVMPDCRLASKWKSAFLCKTIS